MNQISRMFATFMHRFDEYYDSIKAVLIVVLGIAPSIASFLIKYNLNIDNFYFGIAGQGVVWFYRWSQGELREKKRPKGIIVVIGHLVVAGFLSMLLTEYILHTQLKELSLTTVLAAVGIGAFYELLIKRITNAVGVLLNTSEDKTDKEK